MRLFSQKPSKGIKFFHENGLVENTLEAIAKFLHDESDLLDKTAIGETFRAKSTQSNRYIAVPRSSCLLNLGTDNWVLPVKEKVMKLKLFITFRGCLIFFNSC